MNEWLPQSFDVESSNHRVLCFPHAGGGAAVYHRWNRELADIDLVPVHLPGRESRIDDSPLDSLDGLLAEMIPAILPVCNVPFSVFGYSMGALIAFEFVRALREQAARLPNYLFVAACRAPQLPLGREPISQLDEAEMLEQLVTSYGMEADMSPEEWSLMQMMGTTIRADLSLFERYNYVEQPPLDVPIMAIGGASDPQVSRAKTEAWRSQTNAGCKCRFLPGHHFFLRDQHRAILSMIADAVR